MNVLCFHNNELWVITGHRFKKQNRWSLEMYIWCSRTLSLPHLHTLRTPDICYLHSHLCAFSPSWSAGLRSSGWFDKLHSIQINNLKIISLLCSTDALSTTVKNQTRTSITNQTQLKCWASSDVQQIGASCQNSGFNSKSATYFLDSLVCL